MRLRLPGVSVREALSGHYWRLDAPTDERPIAIDLSIATKGIGGLLRDGTCILSGTIDAENLATAQPVHGSVCLKPSGENRIRYQMTFHGDDNQRYELGGEKEWNGFAPLESITLLAASVYDPRGDEMARATLRFDLRAEWANWLKSVRFVWS